MVSSVQIEKIIELHNLAKESAAKFDKKRFVYEDVKKMLENKLFIGIAGLRGVGKTVLLRQLAIELKDSVYTSADAIDPAVNLFELAKELNRNYKTKYLLIDEIHNHANWQMEIKKIYDFLDIKIIFTSSASIDIIRSKYDLSRRVAIINMPPFSFRESLFFRKSVLIEKMSLEDILKNYKKLYRKIYAFEPEFHEFCVRGALPSAIESPFPQTIRNIVEKILNHDLLIYGKLNREDIINIGNILRFISRSPVDVCSYSLIARNAGITKYKAQEYIHILEQAFLLKILMPYGSNVMKEPKILYSLPFRAYFSDGVEDEKIAGAIREEFFIHHISNIDANVNYLKSLRGEKLPDYIVFYKNKKFVFEIGGAGKTRVQLKGISNNRFVLSQPGNVDKGIPLIFFGFLW
ncbi:MAG: AAA family ATPase [Nanoarchaeota archaeon]